MARTIGILLFDGAEEMDFAGPWEVFTAAVSGMPSDRVITIAERSRPITLRDGHARNTGPPLWRRAGSRCRPRAWGQRRSTRDCKPGDNKLAAQCSGKVHLADERLHRRLPAVGADLARGRRVNTHHDFIHDLRAAGGSDVVEGVRFVRDGNLATAAGVMSGIEMSLWLVEQLYGAALAAKAKSYIAYDYPPRGRVEEI